MIQLNIVESGVKHHYHKPLFPALVDNITYGMHSEVMASLHRHAFFKY